MIGQSDHLIHVEAFELSPLNESVISTKGRLRRSYPGPAVALTMELFRDPEFQATMAQTLAKMSHQPAINTKPKSKKAGRKHDENRDTTHPRMVTELFFGFLHSVGTPAKIRRLSKNTREEVVWLNSLLPWRRSPVWLLLRVAMHQVFSRLADAKGPFGGYYKTFMVFLMAKVLYMSLQSHIPCDLLYVMNAKLGRRLLKLDPAVSHAGTIVVEGVMRDTAAHIRGRWKEAIRQTSPHQDLSKLEALDFEHDVFTTLDALTGFVKSLSAGAHPNTTNSFQPTSVLLKYEADTLPTIQLEPGEYVMYNLKVLETWVALYLCRWIEHHKGDADTCGRLGALIASYYRTASPLYSGNPENFSILLLTIVELWIACDQSALYLCKFLEDYDPGVPPEVLQCLLLPFKCQMQRLSRVEDYLKNRRVVARHVSPSIFRDYGRPSCFAVRYFDQSSEHRLLHDDIVSCATRIRDEKVRELYGKKEKYSNLMQRHDESVCEYHEVVVDFEYDIREQRHSANCRRCSYKSEANSIDIEIHEWPLPKRELEAKSAVFELKVPPFFGQWRDTSVFLLSQVLQAESPSMHRPRATHYLATYRGLSSFFVPHSSNARLTLLSENKPHCVTHRRIKSIPNTMESDVCLENGLRYQYFDDAAGSFIDSFHVTDKVTHLLTYQIPQASSSLQQFVFRPCTTPGGPPPNFVIASQSDCPPHMSLDEYKALCVIPLGYRIQWHNVLRELAAPVVDFRKLETSLVILQSIYQAGPPQESNTLRPSHEVLGDPEFVAALLRLLTESLKRVQENWESSQAVTTFTCLSLRLLSLNWAEEITTQCLSYLRDLRTVTFSWVKLLMERAYSATTDSHRAELLFHGIHLALVCVNTFNVDDRYLERVLASSEDASIFLQCCMLIQNGSSTISGASDPMNPILLHRWKSLCYRGYPILAAQISNAQSPCLDDAVRQTWSSYVVGHGWDLVSEEFDYWLFTTLSSKGGEGLLVVHYNLLTGELLVDGLPLARLPSKYLRHATYHTLFGRSDLEVMPSTLPGMLFSAKQNYARYTVHLGMRPIDDMPKSNGNDLLVRSVKDGRIYDLIPSRVLRGEFPTFFVTEFVHWYDVQDDSVEFRPILTPWNSSLDNWRLIRDRGHNRWRLAKGDLSLISLKSETSRAIDGILSPLEGSLDSHLVLQCSSSTLRINLPRLSLAFYLKSGTSFLRSKQFRHFTVDPEQSLETLVGLRSKLILKDEVTGRRLVVLPEGRSSWEKADDYVRVTIDHDAPVKAHAYVLDDQLGRLVDDGDLQSKLWLCYLHALTSFCLVDPFTKRTGTEQGLLILSSAAVRSFDRLREENIDILRRIALLTPGRRYYPASERVMQIVDWDPKLSFLAQHEGFLEGVRLIFNQAERARMFHPESYIEPPVLDHVKPELSDRSRIRSSTFRVSGFGAEDHTSNCDTTYSARDGGQDSSQYRLAFTIANFVFCGQPTLHYCFSPGWSARIWELLARVTTIFGPGHHMRSSELKYDGGLLQDWAEIVAKHWCALHWNLSREQPRINKFGLMIWLCTLAFAKDCDKEVIQSLGAFFVLPRMSQLLPPTVTSFQLSTGATFADRELRSALRSTLRTFAECPESRLARRSRESGFALKQRQQRQFHSNKDRSLNQLVQALKAQWPCETPVLPDLPEAHTYIQMYQAIQIAIPLFKTWHDNFRLCRHLDEVGSALQSTTVAPMEIPSPPTTDRWEAPLERRTFISIGDIFSSSSPSVHSGGVEVGIDNLLSPTRTSCASDRLSSLLNDLQLLARSSFELKYVTDLRASLLSFQNWDKHTQLRVEGDDLQAMLHSHLTRCKELVQDIYTTTVSAATTVDRALEGLMPEQRSYRQSLFAMLADIGQCPRLCPSFFLQQLSRHRWSKIRPDWRRCLTQYALALTELQRAERLVNVSGSRADIVKELGNPGHANWNPIDFPESLVMEVEGNFLIRGVQEDIARQMRDTSENATMQLNMGEGKSSVIIPVVAAALADGSRLVRIITAKPQANQMTQMMVSKLGGLLDRQVYHLPFSRTIRIGSADASIIGDLCRECMTQGGVLLVQPEHILSFKLMGLESLIIGKDSIGRTLLCIQEFFNNFGRDIVDESDDIFNVKHELIYTMGMQCPIEFSPQRWTCIQQVLQLVRTFAPEIARESPTSMEMYTGAAGSFPRTRILDESGQRQLLSCIARRICEVGLEGFPIARQPTSIRQAVMRYLIEPTLSPYEISRVESQGSNGFWSEATSQIILLLRGLLAGGVISFALRQKRWRVQYGLDLRRRPRTKLAVPYRAKDSPTLRSEFSHPDVIIVLTCLSHYYGGIGDDDLFLAFDHLLQSDYADIEYQEWVKDAPHLPIAFRQLSGINLKDRLLCIERIFPALRNTKNVIDYFLTHLVFPKEMREFPHKLSASGWDIGQTKTLPTSGFSGTNDSRISLPLSVTHLDLLEQEHTNALVLEHLLRPENSVVHIPVRAENGDSTAESILDMVTEMDPTVKVILDVGAQILELNNWEVAMKWLEREQDHEQVQAAVFFNEDDELSVLDRDGQVERLQTSPFANHLEVCLVFLDEAHTRGTDLKLPDHYRAAVTLGASLTKDRLVQGKPQDDSHDSR